MFQNDLYIKFSKMPTTEQLVFVRDNPEDALRIIYYLNNNLGT